jgi:hypothetical protein
MRFLAFALSAFLAGGATWIVQDQCGPFTDVTPGFCPYILELYYLGITAGTSATTFSPDDPLTRGQGAVFVAKGLNQALARSSRRAALGQWWTTQGVEDLGSTAVGNYPQSCVSDGADVWVAMNSSVSRVKGSDGKLLETWTNTPVGSGVVSAMGRIFVIGDGAPGQNTGGLFMIDPSQPAGDATEVAANLGVMPLGIAFDGKSIWTANYGGRSVSIVTPGATIPWAVTTVTTGFSLPAGAVFDGTNIWVSDFGSGELLKLDGSGNVLQNVLVGTHPFFPVFDGVNIWVPVNGSSTVAVVQAASGSVVATLSGNGLSNPYGAAFDGQRILVTNQVPQPSVSVWNAADLSPLGTFSIGSGTFPWGACSDGLSFWIASGNPGMAPPQLIRF